MNADARRRLVDAVAVAIIAAGVILSAFAVFGSGVYISFYGIRISSRTLFRPLTLAAAATLWWFYRSRARQQRVAELWARLLNHATAIALLLAVLTCAIAFRVSAFEAYGADSYGYVSQAHLWAAGKVVQDEPLSLKVPWPDPEWTLSPLGYRPGPRRGTIVPIYSAGLPIVMAGLLKLFGTFGPFLAVPLFGSVAIVAAFLLARRIAGDACGLIAAALLLTSPILLFQLKEPMSDVPVTAWWLLALLCITKATPGSLFAGGLAASAAIVTRPNLVPLAAVVALFIATYSADQFRQRLSNAVVFSAGIIPGCIAVAVLNHQLYGSPLSSGYGDMSDLFGLDYFSTNVVRYSQWLLKSETPFILLAAAGAVLLWQRERRYSWLLIAFVTTVYACYAFYLPFDTWLFLRFLLPGVALLLILCSVSVYYLSARLPSLFTQLVLAVIFIGFVAWRASREELNGLQPIGAYGRRFAVVAEYVRDELPQNAIVLSMIHSGSVRYYASRPTLRWDWLAPEWLERSLQFLTNNGYHPFLLIDDWERPQFIERFGSKSSLGALDWAPIATYRGNVRAELFDLKERQRTHATRWIGEPNSR
jgi:hypothetical protein